MINGWPTLSSSVDNIFLFIAGISVVLLAGVTGAMIWFVIRYDRRRHPKAEEVKENVALEITWTVIPTLLVLAIFYVGWKGFVYQRTVPADAMLVKVAARMWSWRFEYENGTSDAVLRVPVNKPVKLAITSADVLHSLFIPAFRVKEDAVPGLDTYLWFLPDRTGSFDLFCTEYCGVGHSAMVSRVDVMPEAEFIRWFASTRPAPARSPAKPSGASLVQQKGCIACHSLDGSPKVGPTLKGIFGRTEQIATSGAERTIVVDEVYLRKSLLEPAADVVKGFPPIMPSQKGLLTEAETAAIVEYLKTLK